MAFPHYVDLMIREGGVAHELHARLLLALHYKVAGGAALAASWPDWRDQPGEFGLLFRVFGNEAHLKEYLEVVAPLVTAGLIRVFAVTPVPDTSAKVCFSRDRSHDAVSPSAARRLARRASDRGEVWQSTRDGQPREAGDHYLIIPSASQNRIFRMYVQRGRKAAASSTSASYGLGHLLPDF